LLGSWYFRIYVLVYVAIISAFIAGCVDIATTAVEESDATNIRYWLTNATTITYPDFEVEFADATQGFVFGPSACNLYAAKLTPLNCPDATAPNTCYTFQGSTVQAKAPTVEDGPAIGSTLTCTFVIQSPLNTAVNASIPYIVWNVNDEAATEPELDISNLEGEVGIYVPPNTDAWLNMGPTYTYEDDDDEDVTGVPDVAWRVSLNVHGLLPPVNGQNVAQITMNVNNFIIPTYEAVDLLDNWAVLSSFGGLFVGLYFFVLKPLMFLLGFCFTENSRVLFGHVNFEQMPRTGGSASVSQD